MTRSRFIAGGAVLAVAAGGAGVGVANAAKTAAAAPKKAIIKESTSFKFKPNRYVIDGLRWKKDTYTVAHGGKVVLVWNVTNEGPHTFTVVKKKDLPKTAKQLNNCKICAKLGKAHGADPNSQAPPKFNFLENGKGQNTPPNVDRPGDSALTGAKPGSKVTLKVTAKAGTVLHFLCLIHPQMQATLKVK